MQQTHVNNRFSNITSLPQWLWLVVYLGGAALLFVILSDFQKTIVSEMLIIGLFALSLNLIMGYGGMVHFGHAAFYGLGGYTVAVTMQELGFSFYFAFILAPFVAALGALIIGWFCVRRVRLYFAILTLAFGQLVYTIAFNARGLTGGDDGITGLEMPALLDTPGNYYIFTVIVFLLCYIALRMIVRSPFVLILKATRENPERAQFIGVNVKRHQLIAFVLGGFFAGIAGGLLVGEQHFVGVEMMFWTTSAVPILASLLGGMYTLSGPAVGAAILVFLELTLNPFLQNVFNAISNNVSSAIVASGGTAPEWLANLANAQLWQFVLGIITITIVLTAPTGLVGLAQKQLGIDEGDV
jgi:branched-chain amino acid transport system permease protein